MMSLCSNEKKKQKPKSLSWENVALCTAACVDVCVLLGALGLSGAWEDIHLIRWSLFKVGVVRKGIDILLDHFVAELVLLLRRRRKERLLFKNTSRKGMTNAHVDVTANSSFTNSRVSDNKI